MVNAESGSNAPGDPVLALLGGFHGQSDAVEIAYQALDLVAAIYAVPRAHLLIRADPFSPQVFTLGRGHVTTPWAEDFTRRPSGLYITTQDATTVVPMTVRDTLTAYCEMALSAHVARSRMATDITTGLSARTVLDDAVRRAASRSARCRWPFSMVLVTATGPGAPGARWQLLADTLRQCVRVTDEVGVVGSGRAMVVLANSGAESVEPFLRRLRARLAEHGSDIGLVAGAASAPAESTEPEQLWHLCETRLAEAAAQNGVGVGRQTGSAPVTAASEVELRLRCLPGVLAVDSTDLAIDRLTVVVRPGHADVSLSASALVAGALSPGVVVTVVESGDQPAPSTLRRTDGISHPQGPEHAVGGTAPTDIASAEAQGEQAGADAGASRPGGDPDIDSPRVVLLNSRFDRSTGDSEVSVIWRGSQAVGRASGSPLASAAQATLTAIEALGTVVPYYVTSVDRTAAAPGSPVVVTLAERRRDDDPGGHRRLGVAAAADEVEAASRATLSALNRLLSKVPSQR